MSTNKPFLFNFLSAFRARSSPTYKAATSSTAGGSFHNSRTTDAIRSQNARAARTITTQSSPSSSTTAGPDAEAKAAAAAVATASPMPMKFTVRESLPIIQTNGTSSISATAPKRSTSPLLSPSPLSRSPGHTTPLARSPPGSSTPLHVGNRGRQRRGSDSSNSSGGFMDVMGAGEKWMIGGRNVMGDEKFYRLGLVTSPQQAGRPSSLDRLSL